MDKPNTPEEILALPVGPMIRHVYEFTGEDFERGYAIVDGKRRAAQCRFFTWIESQPVRVMAHEEGDLIAVEDEDGAMWALGQWADGRWFRQHYSMP